MSNTESERLAILTDLGVLDTPASLDLDRITRVACEVFDVPISLVSLIDCDRQWFKSRVGLSVAETARDISFCTHAVDANETLVVPDALADPRFRNNPLVTHEPGIRFYAGRPLRSLGGFPLGTLCVIDRKSRPFSAHQRQLLDDLATMAEQYFHALESQRRLERARQSHQRTAMVYERIVEQASVGIALVAADGTWLEVNGRFAGMLGYSIGQMHGMRFQQMTLPDDLARSVAAFQQLLSGRTPSYSLEKRYVRSDGKALWVQVAVSRLTDPEDEHPRAIMVATDIASRKQAELDLANLHAELESRVIERTTQLNNAVSTLEREAGQRRVAELQVKEERERFHATLENATDAFIEVDEAGRIQMWNRSAEQTFGWSKQEAIGQDAASLILPPAQRPAHHAAFTHALAAHTRRLMGKRLELTAQRKTGEQFPVEMTLSVTSLGNRTLVNAFIHDISQRKLDEKRIRQAALRLKTITDNLPALVGYVDNQQIYRFHNRQHEIFFADTSLQIDDRHVRQIFGEYLYAIAEPYLQRALAGEEVSFEFQTSAKRGSRWFHIHLVPERGEERDGKEGQEISGAYVLATDITDRKHREHGLQHAATHDYLTGLPNRRSFVQQLDEAMARARTKDLKFALMYIDLDDFKSVNDRFGHDVGDALLRRFSTIAHSAFRADDFIARLAGDEFVAIVEGLSATGDDLKVICDRLQAMLCVEQEIGGHVMRISASIGAAVTDGNTDRKTLLRMADQAMYQAKQQGKGRVVISR
ncbi:PAS domain S-box protein [Pandoraea sp.]|uniref:sensor domain-containing diguanylate cyclase n=1 Tax=Pandoraea sp. TaxID=1883445 RepID=UPI0011FCB907|nr:PAS domain S-box protein [Pandoraea sp.]TAL52823.1 MAG: PAS domain S-box protein [Pandoraea sp.]TAM19732.1 MAG: PAS domain S-box protein [Pandoraea sp.]